MKGRDLFSASLFREPESTRLFYTFIAELKSKIDAANPGPTHRFIKTLDMKGKLLRSYTQNIDGFEEKAGLSGKVITAFKGQTKKLSVKDTKNVQLHGDIQCVYVSVQILQLLMSLFSQPSEMRCVQCRFRVHTGPSPRVFGRIAPGMCRVLGSM
jgi:NAD-dependent histone deacetylase SIR2